MFSIERNDLIYLPMLICSNKYSSNQDTHQNVFSILEDLKNNINETCYLRIYTLFQNTCTIIYTTTCTTIHPHRPMALKCTALDRCNQVVVSFCLEVVRSGGGLGVLRKRIQGDGWYYKRLCEGIFKAANLRHEFMGF